jgi:hypothetical protein
MKGICPDCGDICCSVCDRCHTLMCDGEQLCTEDKVFTLINNSTSPPPIMAMNPNLQRARHEEFKKKEIKKYKLYKKSDYIENLMKTKKNLGDIEFSKEYLNEPFGDVDE